VTALSLALAFLGCLAFVAWRDWLKTKAVVPPHDALKARVETFEKRLRTVEAWGQLKHGEDPFRGA
jgi:hypothetical protein